MADLGGAAVDVRRGLLQARAFRFLAVAVADLAFHHEPLPAVAAGPHQEQVGAAVAESVFPFYAADAVDERWRNACSRNCGPASS